MFKISVPATSANIGPGFDSFGLALDLYNHFYMDYAKDLIFENCKIPDAKNNLVYTSAMSLFQHYYKGRDYPKGLYVKFESNIPLSRGLGSSATCIVAGLLGANLLLGQPYANEELFNRAVDIEGHPDNVASAFFGGLNISTRQSGQIIHKSIRVSDEYAFFVLIPNFKLSTSQSRTLLPRQVPLQDAVDNMANASLMLLSLMDGDKDTLRAVSQDHLHEPYRKDGIADFDVIKDSVLKNGGLSCFLSGSGPSLLCIVDDERTFQKNVPATLCKLNAQWTVRQVYIDYKGVTWAQI